MKIAIISDLHLTHWSWVRMQEVLDRINESLSRELPDLIIDAGDAECRDRHPLRHFADVVCIPGNHDYYGKHCPALMDGCEYFEVGGVKFATAPLWGSLNGGDQGVLGNVKHYLADFSYIPNFTVNTYMDLHTAHRTFLAQAPADVVVTHHMPTFRSVHERWKNAGHANWGFASEDDDLIEIIKPKLWIHGHTHDKCDYMYNDITRVVCNPLGYPRENRGEYLPVYVEI